MSTTDRQIENHSLRLKNYYQFHCGIYDLTRWSFLFGRRTLLDALPDLPPHPRILEIGCGTGKNIEYLEYLLPDAKIYGIDLSDDMLKKAESKIDTPEQVTLINGWYGSEGLPFKPFDLVLLSYTLTMSGCSHVEDILQHVNNDLKSDGYIAVVDFNSTPFNWFRHWMKVNHVAMDGNLLPLLKKCFNPTLLDVRKAYLGLWSYFLFLGQRP